VFSMLHIKGSNTVLVALGSGEIHEVNIATYTRVSTIRSELFEDDPRRCAFSAPSLPQHVAQHISYCSVSLRP
jgi:hypothetical protein